jgi:hypothetical protein
VLPPGNGRVPHDGRALPRDPVLVKRRNVEVVVRPGGLRQVDPCTSISERGAAVQAIRAVRRTSEQEARAVDLGEGVARALRGGIPCMVQLLPRHGHDVHDVGFARRGGRLSCSCCRGLHVVRTVSRRPHAGNEKHAKQPERWAVGRAPLHCPGGCRLSCGEERRKPRGGQACRARSPSLASFGASPGSRHPTLTMPATLSPPCPSNECRVCAASGGEPKRSAESTSADLGYWNSGN